MTDIAIRCEGLAKQYRIGEREPYRTLRDSIANAFTSPFRRLHSAARDSSNGREGLNFWALKDVSFEIKRGEVLGIIGRNGAGKSTLLKILSRITEPTRGHVDTWGRVGSLLEVGTGFHPELTGRDNIFLNGAILGMRRAEIARNFDEIVAFAELEKFIDTPVKRYSSGMYVRLAFAVAAHLEPEILLVDEVLAVGDINFQKKCLGKMGDVARDGRTVVLVSHQLNQIRRLCHRVVWVEGGFIRMNGGTHEVVSAYESAMARGDNNAPQQERTANTKGRFLKWEITDLISNDAHILTTLGPVTVKFTVKLNEPVCNGHHGVALFNLNRQLIWAWAVDNLKLETGKHELRYTFPTLPLRPGPYYWQVSLYEEGEQLDAWECLPEMTVATPGHQHRSDEWNGLLNLPSRFELIERG